MTHYEYLNLIYKDGVWGKQVACGLFGIKEDHFESYQSLDERFIKNKTSTFFFEATGYSMEPMIFERDILIVDRAMTPVSGQIIVAAINGSFVCKTYIKKREQVILRSENKKVKDLLITSEMEMHLFGVVIGIYRKCPVFD
ncbi:MAG: hypothetical protein A2381_15860 [Bdellovibrionales bacterium RIFOXYB1_FULL_37_110]|nr:MAG: hypothetical protein A2417_07710 [Bdellovibrionales bacterium RIFOXYC1_FULL_37_79]OFZ57090.1 MAG: hypothetical protein A2381_15860 [Bdellovibrionales bacterium RIFOXYB1_FULL_37_110]OFZ57376.1 MAG: hypothetical protein A2328_07740 [Bdellovibrionales bacterium RIFOXYB2_FULL_36_6]OFZ62059.1 MAG: hypothetical protein A2577_08370 [Bdellovibrionales bacterium RIFOXYD1_FULL_36_51]